LNSLTIFPNPTNGIINIENNNSIVKDVKVYNTLGQQIEIFFDGNTVDISQASRGTYILEFRDELGASSTMKVIKI